MLIAKVRPDGSLATDVAPALTSIPIAKSNDQVTSAGVLEYDLSKIQSLHTEDAANFSLR